VETLKLGVMSHGHADFAWEELDPDISDKVEAEVLHRLKLFLYKLGDWIHGEGRTRPGGVTIRSYVAFWDVLPYLADLSQVELAALMGKQHKQSVGAEVSAFRDKFGWFNGHMQSQRARQVCQAREAKKSRDKKA
jgi:hypothetical protein